MKPAEIFEKEIERCLAILGEDEWALVKARDKLVATLEPHEAFSSITDILALATRQRDEYAFQSCCWLALQLAGKANTTEIPASMPDLLIQLSNYANQYGELGNNEVKKVASWFRM
jgi:hypothetical protein